MIQRRLTQDDSRGVSEPLNELNSYDKNGVIAKMVNKFDSKKYI